MGIAGLVVAVVGVAVAVVQALIPPAERGAQLEVSDMSVIGEAEVRALFEDMSRPDLGVEEGHVRGDGLDIKVRNTGDTVAVVTAVRLRVDEVRPFRQCGMEGGELEVTHLYDAELPVSAGSTVEVPVSHEVGVAEADRFVLTVGVDDDGRRDAQIYVLTAVLVVDGYEVDLGRAVVAAPWPWPGLYFYGTGDAACERRNINLLEDALSDDAQHSSQLAEAADPDAIQRGPENECGVVAGAFGTVEVTVNSGNIDATCDEAIDVVTELARRPGLANTSIGRWACETYPPELQSGSLIGMCRSPADAINLERRT